MPSAIHQTDITRFRKALSIWYALNHRNLPWRESRNPYHIWVSEVMLQQTQVRTVIPYFLNFVNQFPTVRDLARADLGLVLKLWEGLGYYARARNFHKAAAILSKDYNGIIPDDFSAFINLPGVGEYICAAVQSIAFDRAFAVVDGNVKRVISRLYCLGHPVNATGSHGQFKEAADRLLDKDDPGLFNQAMMELGALICSPKNPGCPSCPVSNFCEAFSSGRTTLFPRRVKKDKVPTRYIAAGVIQKKGRVLITRRRFDGLLGGLWEFPGGKLEKGEDPASACIREILEETGITVEIDSHLATIHHAYTHFKIVMDVFHCHYISGRIRLKGPIDHEWIRPADMDRFAFPKANLKFIPLIRI